MAKIKIEIEIDVDFQEHFDSIPQGLFKNQEDNRTVDDYYMLESVHDVLNDAHMHQLIN